MLDILLLKVALNTHKPMLDILLLKVALNTHKPMLDILLLKVALNTHMLTHARYIIVESGFKHP